jgi:regulator of cell morphogenesis and NO signaling
MTGMELTISNIIEDWPGAVAVFERHRIEYYLHGDMEFGEVCRNLKKNPAIVLDEIRQESGDLPKTGTRDWTVAYTIDYILKNHHEPTYRMLEEIHLLFRQLEHSRGFLDYDLSLLKESLLDLEDYLIEHLQEEEAEIFPLLLAKTSAGSHPRRDVELFDAITWIREDHLLTGSILKRLHELGAQVVDPDDQGTLMQLFSRLGDLERDLHYHMHLENNVLFGKFT